jgi:hypothetical protein
MMEGNAVGGRPPPDAEQAGKKKMARIEKRRFARERRFLRGNMAPRIRRRMEFAIIIAPFPAEQHEPGQTKIPGVLPFRGTPGNPFQASNGFSDNTFFQAITILFL